MAGRREIFLKLKLYGSSFIFFSCLQEFDIYTVVCWFAHICLYLPCIPLEFLHARSKCGESDSYDIVLCHILKPDSGSETEENDGS